MIFLARFQPIVYVRLAPDVLSVRDVRARREVVEPPLVAISQGPKKTALAVGEAARTAAMRPGVSLVNPFKHPRMLLSDFTAAEVVFNAFLKKLLSQRLFALSPIVIMHPRVDPEGGFTQIELRALRELGASGGRRTVFLCLEKRDLTDAELLGLKSDSAVV